MTPPNEQDTKALINRLDSNSQAGTLSPLLLKLATTHTWTITQQKSKSELKREAYITKTLFNNHADTHPLLKNPNHKYHHPDHTFHPTTTTKKSTITPFRGLYIITNLIRLCLLTKDIPAPEKSNLITAIPKKHGITNTMDNIRPISVGPIIGRMINKLMAERLGSAIIQHNLMDPAQFAFQPGKSIHEPITSIMTCFRQALKAKPGTKHKACYAIFYDISKAYDTLPWSSITRALHRLGLPQPFIDFAMNTLRGTKISIKTGQLGKATLEVELFKAVKQGCPLAPLLFTIVLDELHAGYRKIQNAGYQLNTGELIHSRGFCDDTCILAQDLPTLQKMNKFTAEFMHQHNFKLSHAKTIVMGRDIQGKPLQETLIWPLTNAPLTLQHPSQSVRYLGAHINMDDTWHTQIAQLNGTIMSLLSCIRHRRLTLVQIGLVLREVTIAKLNTGFRHARITPTQLQTWDRYISNAILHRADLSSSSIHNSSVWTTLGILSPSREYALTKYTHTLDLLTKPSELQNHYQHLYTPFLQQLDHDINQPEEQKNLPIHTTHPITHDLTTALKHGLHIIPNDEGRINLEDPPVSPGTEGEDNAT